MAFERSLYNFTTALRGESNRKKFQCRSADGIRDGIAMFDRDLRPVKPVTGPVNIFARYVERLLLGSSDGRTYVVAARDLNFLSTSALTMVTVPIAPFEVRDVVPLPV